MTTNEERAADRIVTQCNAATVKQFRDRLAINVLIAAYVERRFRERFPAAYLQWRREQQSPVLHGYGCVFDGTAQTWPKPDSCSCGDLL